jgi:hypothetical protein
MRRTLFAVLAFAVGCGAVMSRQESRQDPPSRYGTKDQIVERFGVADVIPASSFSYSIGLGASSNIGLYKTADFGYWYANGHLPTGSVLTYVELDYCDSNPTEDVHLTVIDCNYLGADCHDLKVLSSSDGSSECGFVSANLTSLNYRMDAFHRQILVAVETLSSDSSTKFLGAYLGYRLQISDPPATPTFTDVPASHPYFRAIEALAASGITGGCGAGNFCPNQNVTRGEMAAFLARALGLHFPN